MRRNQPEDSRFEEYDEHNQPTEPMSQIILTPFSPAPDVYGTSSIPASPLDEQHFPSKDSNAFLAPGMPNRSKISPAYPFLPAAPGYSRNNRPPGGAYPVVPPAIVQPRKRRHNPGRSAVPALIGFLFVLIQLLLLVRVALQLLGQSANLWWVGLIYNISDVFVLPFRLLLANVNIPLVAGTDLYNYLLVLLAILLYGLISRILVRFLKALLHSR
jgi:hypothetical protein